MIWAESMYSMYYVCTLGQRRHLHSVGVRNILQSINFHSQATCHAVKVSATEQNTQRLQRPPIVGRSQAKRKNKANALLLGTQEPASYEVWYFVHERVRCILHPSDLPVIKSCPGRLLMRGHVCFLRFRYFSS